MEIITVEGTELSELLRTLRSELREDHDAIHTMRVSVQGGRVMFKVNEGAWTAGYGTTPPSPQNYCVCCVRNECECEGARLASE